MAINIHDYVDRYLNTYVHYHWQSFSGNADHAAYLFEGRYQEAIDDISAATFGQQLLANEYNSADKQGPAAVLDIADQIANGTLLQETLDAIALSVNQAIENKAQNINLQDLYAAALSYASLLENGHAQYRDIHAFLTILAQAINQAGGYNAQFLAELRQFGRIARGKKFNFNPGDAKIVSQIQLENLNKIRLMLERAEDKFLQSGGQLSAASFRGTITAIFRRVLANAVGTNLIASAFQDGEAQIDEILKSLGFKSESSSPHKSKTKARFDVINNETMRLSITQNDNTTVLEIGTNLRILDSNGISKQDINILARSTMGQMFDENSPTKYYAYNLMAHRDVFEDEYNLMRASIAASFMRDTIMGVNKQQTYQFLMVEGKVYPILTIVKNICDSYLRNGGQYAFGFQIEETNPGDNAWKTSGNVRGPSIQLAILRSNLINEIISKLTIALNYNSNILSNYINKT